MRKLVGSLGALVAPVVLVELAACAPHRVRPAAVSPPPAAPARASLGVPAKLPFASAYDCALGALREAGFQLTTDRRIGAVTGTWLGGSAAGDVAGVGPTMSPAAVAAGGESDVVAVAITPTEAPALAPLSVRAWAADPRSGALLDRPPSPRARELERTIVERCGGEKAPIPAGAPGVRSPAGGPR